MNIFKILNNIIVKMIINKNNNSIDNINIIIIINFATIHKTKQYKNKSFINR